MRRKEERNKIIYEQLEGRFLAKTQKKYDTKMKINKISFYKENEYINAQLKGKTFFVEELRFLNDVREKGLYLVCMGRKFCLYMRGEKAIDCFLKLEESEFIILGRILKVSKFKP